MKDMETIEEIYAEMFEAHEFVLAAKRQERIKAANPYGCNQYGEGWKAPHNGKQSWRPGNKANKSDSSQNKGSEPQKREGEHFDNIKDEMVDAIAHALIHNQQIFSSGFSFSGTKRNTLPASELLITREDLQDAMREYNETGNAWKAARRFVEQNGQQIWNNNYSPKYQSRKK